MNIHKVPGVCSMLTISRNPHRQNSYKETLRLLYETILDYNADERRKNNMRTSDLINPRGIKAVLMVDTGKWYDHPAFTNVTSYKGNESKKARVRIIKAPKGLTSLFIKHGIGDINF